MSTSPPPPAPVAAIPSVPQPLKDVPHEIKVFSHSMLFYWCPVWFFGLVFAALTYVDNNRLAIVGAESKVVKDKAPDGREVVGIRVEGNTKRVLDDSTESK